MTNSSKTNKLRIPGINIVGDVQWGTHLCHFYKTKEDLMDILVPYFKAGLENNEFCMWVTSEPLNIEDAKAAMEKAVPNFNQYLKKGQIEILDYSQWYTKTGKFEADKVLGGLVKKEKQAIQKGFNGLRLTGNTFWLEKKDWKKFVDYEEIINNVLHKYKMIAICTYSLDKCDASEIIDVVGNHQFALIRREGKWEIIKSSEKKKAEESLKESEERFRQFFENEPEYCYMISPDGKIFDVNESALETLGYKKEEIVGKPLLTTIYAPSSQKKAKGLLTKWKKVGKLRNEELNIITKTGRERTVLLSADAVKSADGKIIHSVSIQRDITERKKAEETIKKQLEELRELDKAKTDFLNIISHELKTPLTAMSAHLDVLDELKSNLTKQEIKSLEALERNNNQLKTLIDNILEISRIESKRFNLNIKKINLEGCIDDVIRELKIFSDKKGIKLITKIDKLPLIKDDEERVKEILNNLIDNAIKFTEKGSVTIEAKRQNKCILVTVTDTGIGIPKNKIPQLFKKFYQVDASLGRKYGGTGLGLAITKQLVELQGGRINVKSVLGKGSSFSFTLPVIGGGGR